MYVKEIQRQNNGAFVHEQGCVLGRRKMQRKRFTIIYSSAPQSKNGVSAY